MDDEKINTFVFAKILFAYKFSSTTQKIMQIDCTDESVQKAQGWPCACGYIWKGKWGKRNNSEQEELEEIEDILDVFDWYIYLILLFIVHMLLSLYI